MLPHSCQTPHFVLFHKDSATLGKRVARYVADAVHAGSHALVIAQAGTLQQVDLEFHQRQLDTAGGGRLLTLDAEAVLEKISVDGKPDPHLFDAVVGSAVRSLCDGGRPLAVYGEVVGVLCERGQHDEAVQLEDMWNALLAGKRVSLFCGYARSLFETPEGAPFYERVRATHTSAYDDARGFMPGWLARA